MSEFLQKALYGDSEAWGVDLANDFTTEPMPKAFARFLLRSKKGPGIDPETANLLWRHGVTDFEMFGTFLGLPLKSKLAKFQLDELEDLNVSSFVNLLLYKGF